jgi:hypothetical protein
MFAFGIIKTRVLFYCRYRALFRITEEKKHAKRVKRVKWSANGPSNAVASTSIKIQFTFNLHRF